MIQKGSYVSGYNTSLCYDTYVRLLSHCWDKMQWGKMQCEVLMLVNWMFDFTPLDVQQI